MSLSQSRNSKAAPEGGTIIYMPPENYEPGQKARASVKHDIYRCGATCSELTAESRSEQSALGSCIGKGDLHSFPRVGKQESPRVGKQRRATVTSVSEFNDTLL